MTQSNEHDNGRYIVALAPTGMPNWMVGCWMAAVLWGCREEEVMGQYRYETGDEWLPDWDRIGRLVDQATDEEWAFAERFVGWFNDNVWGRV